MLCLDQPLVVEKEKLANHDWNKLYTFLHSYVPRIVYAFHFAAWRGQEEDVIEDVIQETTKRVSERIARSQRGEAEAIRFPERMSMVIAMNYCRDIIRRDARLIRLQSNELYITSKEAPHGLDLATENVYQYGLFNLLAYEINQFPDKQRVALMIDLAHRMSFDKQPTPLQEAFLAVGVRLEDYKQYTFDDIEERSRHAALLTHAYKRIEKLASIQIYKGDAPLS